MTFHFYSPVAFEDWDYRNPDTKGIGGSEVSHIEMAKRFARRGHTVISYSPLPKDCPDRNAFGVEWKHLNEADFAAPGNWMLYRCPEVLDRFTADDKAQLRWLICQDTAYHTLTKERVAKLDRVVALCGDHAKHVGDNFPYLRDKLWITSNGLRCDLVREVDYLMPQRNPFKMVYASSPDRGLITLLKIFKKAKEFVPALELHVFYGFDNISKLQGHQKLKAKIKPLLKQKGVHWRGRVNQRQLYKEWATAGLWVQPTDFTETSCITCMEAQALGAYPITRPLWALRENVAWGTMIEGSPANDPLAASRYVAEIVHAVQGGLADKHRVEMMRWARYEFNWDRFVDQWEMTLLGIDKPEIPTCQFAFQRKHARGRILNVGCDIDTGNFYTLAAVNMDVREISPITKLRNKAHIFHDAREPFPECIGSFDSVVLGDILEHMEPNDAIKVLKNTQAVLLPEGRVIVTVPDDYNRTALEQHYNVYGHEEYAPGCSAFHYQHLPKEQMQDALAKAGFDIFVYQPLDYSSCDGHAFVGVKTKEVQ